MDPQDIRKELILCLIDANTTGVDVDEIMGIAERLTGYIFQGIPKCENTDA